MKIVATSDLHGHLPEIPACDLLLIAGDIVPDNFTPGGQWWTQSDQKQWLRETFDSWLIEDVPAKNVVIIGGNHDYPFKNSGIGNTLDGCFYLEDKLAVINGLRIYGTPWVPTFGRWAFMKDDNYLAEHWRKIPRDIDILITHGPPWGFGDLVGHYEPELEKYSMEKAEHVGSKSLADQLWYDEWPNLKLHVFGHIHSQYGMYNMKDVPLYNCSYVNYEYKPTNAPWEVDL